MKKFKALFVLTIFVIVISTAFGCDSFKIPQSKTVTTTVSLFNNIKFNSIGLMPQQIVIKKDLSGSIVYNVIGDAENLKTSIINAVDNVNESAYGEGDYLAGYRAIYIQEKNIKQSDDFVTVTVEFSNINHLSSENSTSEVVITTLEEYLAENSNIDENFNYIDTKGNQSSLVNTENKEDFYLAVCKNIGNQAFVIVDDCTICAYYTESDNAIITLNKDSIKSSSGEVFKFVFTQSDFPLLLVLISAGICLLFISVLVYKIVKSKQSIKTKQ